MQLVRVVLKSTSGEETSVLALLDDDVVVLPDRLRERMRAIQSMGEYYALTAEVDGETHVLEARGDAQFTVRRSREEKEGVWIQVRNALSDPTWDQLQGYSRIVHTLSAACVIGLATIVGDVSELTWRNVTKVIALATLAIFLLIFGATLLKGERSCKEQ